MSPITSIPVFRFSVAIAVISHSLVFGLAHFGLSAERASTPLHYIYIESWRLLPAGRQRELKDRAAGIVRRRPQAAAVGLDDRTADRQSPAHAFALGGVDRVEDVLKLRRAQPRAGVADGQEYAVRFVLRRADEHLSWSIADCACGFNGVNDQIQNYLL